MRCDDVHFYMHQTMISSMRCDDLHFSVHHTMISSMKYDDVQIVLTQVTHK